MPKNVERVDNDYRHHIASRDEILAMKDKHKVLATYSFEPTKIERGYNSRSLYISVGGSYDTSKQDALTNSIIGESGIIIGEKNVTEHMKEKFTGGRGFDLYHLWKSVAEDTKWDSPENNVVISPGPLAGITQYPGTGKSLVCAISPLTGLPFDSNVGGFFGPFLKFAGFDILELQGKSEEELIIFIDGNSRTVSVETAPEEAIDSHILCEQLTEMYAENDADKMNISVVKRIGKAVKISRAVFRQLKLGGKQIGHRAFPPYRRICFVVAGQRHNSNSVNNPCGGVEPTFPLLIV